VIISDKKFVIILRLHHTFCIEVIFQCLPFNCIHNKNFGQSILSLALKKQSVKKICWCLLMEE